MSSRFIPEFYDNQSDWDLAASITIGEGVEISGIDAVLTAVAYGAISGRVTNKEGMALPQAEVDVYGETGSTSHAECYTQEDGSYFISGLLDGNYKIEFHGSNLYFTEFYNDKADMASADLVSVSGGRTTENIDAVLARKIEVISPNGGESWQAGTTHPIIWTSTDTIPNVKIELSFDGGGLWSTVVASAPNYGSFTWDIGTTPSLNCVMRISDAYGLNVTDTSDGMFVLTSPPSLTNNYFISPVKWTDATFGDDGWYTGDFDGDGRTDLMRFTEINMRSEVLLSTGTAFAAPVNWLTAVNGDDGWHIGDFNGDGRDDVLSYVAGLSGGRVFLSDGTQFVDAGSWTGSGCGEDGWYVGDFNGDGKDDLLRYIAEAQRSEVLLSDGTRFTLAGSWSAAWNGTDGWYVGDYNGDGRSDLLRYNPGVSGGEAYFSDGTLFTYGGSWTGAGNGDNGWYLGKFSGTARHDIMRYVLLLSGADVFLNSGSGFTYDGSWTPAGRGDDDWHVGDFNGDGRDDLLRSIIGVTGADVLLSAVTSGAPMSAAQSAVPAGERNARWLNDVPAHAPLSAGEISFVQGIKERIAGGEPVSIYQIQREYEKLTGKTRTRAGIMKLLKRQQKDQPSYRQAKSG
jgi:hypothetical protein